MLASSARQQKLSPGMIRRKGLKAQTRPNPKGPFKSQANTGSLGADRAACTGGEDIDTKTTREEIQMPDVIRRVDYFYIETTDKPGEGARILQHLKDAGVNLVVLHAFPAGRRTQVDFVPTSDVAFKAAAKAAKWKVVGPKKAFVIEGEDRVGALADTAGAGRFGAILWVKPRDARRAAKALTG